MKNNRLFLLLPILLLAGCGGMSAPPINSPEDIFNESYVKIFNFDYNDNNCEVYMQKDTSFYYTYIYSDISLSKWTFSYEYHPEAYIDTNIADDLMYKLYEEAKTNLDIFNSQFEKEVNVYPHEEIFYFEQTIHNDLNQTHGIALIEEYLNFTIVYNRNYYHISIPARLTFLKQYSDQIQDFNNNYVSISEFIRTYKMTVKGE